MDTSGQSIINNDDQDLVRVLSDMNKDLAAVPPPAPTSAPSAPEPTVEEQIAKSEPEPVVIQEPVVAAPVPEPIIASAPEPEPVPEPELIIPPALVSEPEPISIEPEPAPRLQIRPEPSVESIVPPREPAHSEHTESPVPLESLEDVKKSAITELRPLVDKLDLPSEEKFNTLLLIIRSTDDSSLVNSAHKAAMAIEDDSKRAEALLDIIKEVDYFTPRED